MMATRWQITEADIAESEAAIQASRTRLKRYESVASLREWYAKEDAAAIHAEADKLEAQLRLDGLQVLAGQDTSAQGSGALEAKVDALLDAVSKLSQGGIYEGVTPNRNVTQRTFGVKSDKCECGCGEPVNTNQHYVNVAHKQKAYRARKAQGR